MHSLRPAHVRPARETPGHVLRGLLTRDPRFDLLYIGHGVWILGRWMFDQRFMRNGERALGLFASEATQAKMQTPEGHEMHALAELKRDGFRPMYPYRLHGEPTWEVVDAVTRGEWEIDNLSHADFLKQMDAPREKRSADALRAVRDEYAQKELVRYGLRRPLSVTVDHTLAA